MKKFITHVGLLALTIFATIFLGISAVNAQSSAYDSAGLAAPTVTTDQADYLPGETAHITGSGWTLDQGVHVEFKETPDYPDYHIYDLAVNPDGTWQIDYAIEVRHLGVSFNVVVDGKQSGYRATTLFTDAPGSVTVSSVSPNSGPFNANTPVTITGTNLFQNNGLTGQSRINYTYQVTFDNVIVIGTPAASGTTLTTSAPIQTSALGNVKVTVTRIEDNNSGFKNNAFDYQKVTPVISWNNPANIPYGTALSGTQLNASSGGVAGTFVYTPTSGTVLDAGTNQTLSVTFTPTNTTNYNTPAAKTVSINVSKVTPVISWNNPADITYGTALSSTELNATSGGVAGTFVYTPASGTVLNGGNGQTLSVSFTPTNTTNYNTPVAKTASINVLKADATIAVSGYTGVYDGNAHGATGTTKGVKNEALTGLILGASFTNVPGGTATWTYTDATGNYKNATGTAAIVISKADATIAVSGYTDVYDGDAHGATGTAKGVKDEDLSSLLHLGNSFTNVPGGTANWTFDGNGNYKTDAGTAAIVISKADATIAVNGYTGVYDGNAHGATGTAKGVKNEALTGLSLGASFTNVPGGTATWTYTDATGNYKDQSGTAAIVISNADATIAVNGYTGVYDGNAHGATGTAKGVKNEALTGLNLGASFTNVPGGTATWTYTDATGNYKDQSSTAAIVISKADATIAVNGYTGVYDGDVHGATGSASGVKDEDLSTLLHLGSSFTNVPGGTANWTFDGNGNYKSASGTAAIVISKADATIAVNGYTGVYDGNAHGATGTAKGVKNEALTGLNLGASFTNVPGGTATWTYTDATGNYKDATGTAAIVISKADATIAVNGYTGVYDGNAHGATGTATGVKSENLATLLHLGSSFTNVPGGTANWTFDGNGNYNSDAGTAAIVISKADATIAVNGYTGVYDGDAHGATGTAKGVKNEALTGLNLGASFTNVPGGTATWTYTDATGNYKDATGTAKGVSSESLTGLNLSATTHTNAGTYATDAWTFTDATGNYNNKSGTVSDAINKATTSITVANVSGTQGGHTTLTATLKDISNNLLLSGKIVTFKVGTGTPVSAITDANGVATLRVNACAAGTTQATFAGESNYLSSNNTATLTVSAPTYVWSGTNVMTTPQQLPTTGGITITPTITFTGLTLTNVSINWDDNSSTPISGTFTNSVSSSHKYLIAGVYGVKLTGTDVCGSTVTNIYQYIVIYDPSGGFVTGGGWFNSPAGACKTNLTATGKANFGINSKYKSGSTIPTGETEFNFQAGNLKFNSSSYEDMSLVIGAGKASYKGSGTINGTGSYSFMLVATDGDVTGGDGVDRIRMKIWDKATGNLVYDNQIGASDNTNPTTAIGGGSIVIHTDKQAKPTTVESAPIVRAPVLEIEPLTLKAYPNPSTNYFTVKLQSRVNEKAQLKVFDASGRPVYLTEGSSNQTYRFGDNFTSGAYFLKVTQGEKQQILKLIKLK